MPIPQLELVSHHLCPYVQRAVIMLLEKNIPHQRTDIDLVNKPDWFRRISPLGKVPLLKVEDEILFESAVICEYLDEITLGSLHPSDPLQKAKHRAWIEFGSSTLNTIAGFYSATTPETFEQKRHDLIDKFVRIEHHLSGAPYFAGEVFSLVDAVYGPIFRYFDVFDTIAEFDIFLNAPKVKRWRQALQARPSIQQAVAEDYPQRLLMFLKQRNSQLSARLAA
ncbi:glutathione S-transferase family protein [Leptolyngbya sp. FACHB-36]|uniref:glutathione S-transferase family protein n=1 Tax=Leptolyngbya sp. FACHB-36 TaxID=2692808 RepID=UPI00168185F2|nr:glutathione S-transferase family protein [Leptolyngbya sp. FACHB-36]MBD2018925.1 glutathione S-transferase family protein [Leptolyngbya sp. FACHB-36]